MLQMVYFLRVCEIGFEDAESEAGAQCAPYRTLHLFVVKVQHENPPSED